MPRTVKKGGMYFNSATHSDIYSSINSFIANSYCKIFGMDSRSGTNIIASAEYNINPDYVSPFVSANLDSFGQPVRRLLFKLVAITSQAITYEPWAGRKKDTSTPHSFINEVSIQQDIYKRTNYLGEPLCPAIISSFVRIPNDSLVQNLLSSCVKYQFFIEEYIDLFEYHFNRLTTIINDIKPTSSIQHATNYLTEVEKIVNSFRGTIEKNPNSGYRIIDEIHNNADLLDHIDTVRVVDPLDIRSIIKYIKEVKDMVSSIYAILIDVLDKVAVNRDHLTKLIEAMQTGRMRVGIIAMELLDGYDVFSTFYKMNNELTQRTYISSAYAFLRLCVLGYRHNDLHHANMMVTRESDYVTGWPRIIIIDFGRTTMHGSRVQGVSTMNDINIFDADDIAKLFKTYFDNIPTQHYSEAEKDGTSENNTFARMNLQGQGLVGFAQKLVTYMNIRQKTIMTNITNNKYHNESGVLINGHRFAPIQYRETGKLLRSFTEVVCDIIHTGGRCFRLKPFNPSGVDTDIILLISAVIGKKNITAYKYHDLPLYNEIVTSKLLPEKLHHLMDGMMDQLKKERDELKKQIDVIQAKQPEPKSKLASRELSEKKSSVSTSTPKRKSVTPPNRD